MMLTLNFDLCDDWLTASDRAGLGGSARSQAVYLYNL